MKKCFEGINSVKFDSSRKGSGLKDDEIIKIRSKEGEEVDLINKIYPFEYDGKVEMWLSDLEQSMKESIKSVIVQGLNDYPPAPPQDERFD